MTSEQLSPTFDAVALAAKDTTGVLQRLVIQRRKPSPDDVQIRVLFCGICHSDVHQIRAEWSMNHFFPMVPGHEIVGVVEEVGENVKHFSKGQHVGVGCMVDSCRGCDNCNRGLEQYCRGNGGKDCGLWTYNCLAKDPNHVHIKNHADGELMFGGYSSHVTVAQRYVFSVPSNVPLERAGPLMCAGITVYSPLRHFGEIAMRNTGSTSLNVGIAGLGGLGHMGVKIAKALGHNVTVISHSSRKRAHALEMGADNFLDSGDAESVAKVSGKLHLIIDTISANHDIGKLVGLVGTDGVVCLVGIPTDDFKLAAGALMFKRATVCASGIGGMPETQEMIDFCAKHSIFPDVEMIDAKDVNHAIYNLVEGKNGASRYVIRIGETLPLDNATWETEQEPLIDPSTFHPNPKGCVVPPTCNHTLKQ